MNPIFFEIHHNLAQEAPGNNETTQLAFQVIATQLRDNIKMVDIGCGPGRQTLTLAQLTNNFKNCEIIAIDFYPQYLDFLRQKN